MMTSGLRTVVIDSFRDLPIAPGEPWEDKQDIRNAHFYIAFVLTRWEDNARKYLGEQWHPFPWYRQKAICQRIGMDVSKWVREALPDRQRVYSQTQADEMWHEIDKAVDQHAKAEYRDYYKKITDMTAQYE
jgi:hypothetical protein